MTAFMAIKKIMQAGQVLLSSENVGIADGGWNKHDVALKQERTAAWISARCTVENNKSLFELVVTLGIYRSDNIFIVRCAVRKI